MSQQSAEQQVEALYVAAREMGIDTPERRAIQSAEENCALSVRLGEFAQWSVEYYGCWLSTYSDSLNG